jgi:LuxR family maltose regulon positive regulatory protein
MEMATPILRIKLHPPENNGWIPRENHQQLRQEILNHRLTTVTAGPGYGKSALVAQTLANLTPNLVWYRQDKNDLDPSTLLSYLCAGIADHHPAFDFPLPDNLTELMACQEKGTALLKTFLIALEPVSNDTLVIVFDDFHTVQESSPLRDTLCTLLRYAPSEIHMVIISREQINLPLSSLRAEQQLKELQAEDLLFSLKETRTLFDDRFGLQLDQEQLERLTLQYSGWITGLILLGQSLKRRGAGKLVNYLEAACTLPVTIHDYFNEVVFQPLDTPLKTFLLETALIDSLEVDFCQELTARCDSDEVLKSLLCRGLFTECKQDSDRFRYHPLLQTFLRQKLADNLNQDEVRAQHLEIATLYEKRGEMVEALQHYLAGGDDASLCRLLDQVGQSLFQEGHFDLLNDCLCQMTTETLAGYPQVECLRGRLLGFFGNPANAAQAYQSALCTFREQDDQQGIQQCLMEIAISNYHIGEMALAAEMLADLLAMTDLSEEMRIEAAGYQIFLTAYLKDQPQWQELYSGAATVLDEINALPLNSRQRAWLDVYRGYAFNAVGERTRALETGRSVAWRLQELRGEHGVHSCYALIANVCFYLQRFEEGLEWAEKGIALLTQGSEDFLRQPARSSPSGSRVRGTQDTVLPLLLHHAANNAFGLGKNAEAIAYARQSATGFRAMGVKWGEAWALNMLSTAYAQKGDLVLAEQSSLAALDCYQGLNLPRIEGSIKGNLSVYLIAKGRYQEALPLLEAAERTFTPKHLASWVDLWYANYHWRQNREKGRRRLHRALTLFDRNQDYGILAERHWIIPLLVDSYARGQFRNYIMKVLRLLGDDALRQMKDLLIEQATAETKSAVANLLRELPKPAPPGLKISMLGQFRVTIGEQELPGSSWRNRKARTLLQYLAHELTKGYIAREVLTELLWPEGDPKKTKNLFHVAMTALRKVLEPDLPEGVPSAYISRSGEAYRLQLGDGGYVDLHEFSKRLAQAQKESSASQALKLRIECLTDYHGELLAEDPYCEWCFESRHRLQQEYLNTIEKIMRHYAEHEDFSQCIGYAESYLEVDPTAESIYRELMSFHARTGNLQMVAVCLKRCRENLQNKLDCLPEQKTEQLARDLLGDAFPSIQ